MTQDATTKQTTPNRPGITRPVFCCSGSGAVPESSLIFVGLPALGLQLLLSMLLFTVLLVLAKRARARILDRWQGCVLLYLKSIGWVKCGALDDFVKRAMGFVEYQGVRSDHCYVNKVVMDD